MVDSTVPSRLTKSKNTPRLLAEAVLQSGINRSPCEIMFSFHFSFTLLTTISHGLQLCPPVFNFDASHLCLQKDTQGPAYQRDLRTHLNVVFFDTQRRHSRFAGCSILTVFTQFTPIRVYQVHSRRIKGSTQVADPSKRQ